MARSRKDDVRSKGERQQAILRLVREYPISRQEVLLDYLSKEGFEVTQATVSRDIRELCLVKCYSGMANAACEVFDALQWKNVVGTLSGDDTFLIVARSERDAKTICSELIRHIVQK